MLKQVVLTLSMAALCWGQNNPAAAATEPDRAEAYYQFTRAHMYAQLAIEDRGGDYVDQAIEAYKLALAADPRSALLAEELSDFYIQTNRLREARDDAEAALQRNPDDLAAHRLLARIFVRQISDRQNTRIDTNMLRRAIEEYQKITELDSGDVDSWVLLGRLQRVAQEPEASEQAFQGALKIDPENEDALTGLAALLLERGDSARAAELFKRVADNNPTAGALQRLAGTYEEMGEYALAAETIRKALGLNPSNGDELRAAMASDLINSGQLEEAAGVFSEIADADGGNADAYRRLSEVYAELGEFDKARDALDKAMAIEPDNLDLQIADVAILQGERKPREAVARMREIIDATASGSYGRVEQANRILMLERLALMYRMLEMTDEAVATYREIVELDGTLGARFASEIITTYRAGKKFDQANAEAERASKEWPDDRGIKVARAGLEADMGRVDQAAAEIRGLLDGTDDRGTYLSLAEIYQTGRQFDQVANALDEAEDRSISDDEKFVVWFMRGSMFERMQDVASAEKEFRKALELFPTNANVLNYLGYMLADRNVRLQEALDMIQQAVDQEPNNGAYLDSLGWVYYRMGRYPEAEEEMRRAVDLAPLDPTMHDHFADVLVEQSKYKEAVAAYEESLRQWQANAPADQDQEEIDNVRSKLEQARQHLAQ